MSPRSQSQNHALIPCVASLSSQGLLTRKIHIFFCFFVFLTRSYYQKKLLMQVSKHIVILKKVIIQNIIQYTFPSFIIYTYSLKGLRYIYKDGNHGIIKVKPNALKDQIFLISNCQKGNGFIPKAKWWLNSISLLYDNVGKKKEGVIFTS